MQSGALARCLGRFERDFGQSHWGRAPLLVRGADPHGFADLLDLDGVDELLSERALRTPFVRLVRAGEVLGSGSFTGSGGVGAEIDDQVREDAVAALFAGGATVVLQALHRSWPPVAAFATRLNGELGHPVQVNAYVTPASSQGFAAHYDVHDVFVLQLAGRKWWTIHPPVHADPLRHQPWGQHADAVSARARDEPAAIDTELAPGDALYLPRGWLHAATARGEVSAHLTVGVHVITHYALVEAMTALVADDPALRASLPLGLDVGDAGALAPHLDTVATQLVAAVARLRPGQVAHRAHERAWRGVRPEPVRPLALNAFADGLVAGDAVRRRTGARCRLLPGDPGRIVLDMPERRIDLPASTAPAVLALLDGCAHRVGSLPDLDPADQIVLVRRLLREGVLVPAEHRDGG